MCFQFVWSDGCRQLWLDGIRLGGRTILARRAIWPSGSVAIDETSVSLWRSRTVQLGLSLPTPEDGSSQSVVVIMRLLGAEGEMTDARLEVVVPPAGTIATFILPVQP